MLSNPDIWLLVLLIKKELHFKDIKGAVENIDKRVDEIFGINLPRSLKHLKFKYAEKKKHPLFHLILDDLDLLCKKGEVLVAYEIEEETGDLVEKFKITPKGEVKAIKLVLDAGQPSSRVL
jgi:hypothetical protein